MQCLAKRVKSKYVYDANLGPRPDYYELNKWILCDAYFSVSSITVLILTRVCVRHKDTGELSYYYKNGRSKCVRPNIGMFLFDAYTGEPKFNVNVQVSKYEIVYPEALPRDVPPPDLVTTWLACLATSVGVLKPRSRSINSWPSSKTSWRGQDGAMPVQPVTLHRTRRLSARPLSLQRGVMTIVMMMKTILSIGSPQPRMHFLPPKTEGRVLCCQYMSLRARNPRPLLVPVPMISNHSHSSLRCRRNS
jgi:hypothetical protein